MVRFAARWFLLIFPGVFAASAFAQTAAPHVEPASHRAAHASPFAPLPQQLFGAIPLSTRSEEARKTLELAWDKRSEEHTSELQSRLHLVCRLLLEKKKQLKDSTLRRRRSMEAHPRGDALRIRSVSGRCAHCALRWPCLCLQALRLRPLAPSC